MRTVDSVLRADYWEQKHRKPGWSDSIHFGVFSAPEETLETAVNRSDSLLVQRILSACSIWSISQVPRILDFGCGNGSFLRQWRASLPRSVAIGIDVSETAISKARSVDMGVEYFVGGVEALERISEAIDVLVCRDVWYLLSEVERLAFWRFARSHLSEGGIVVVADLVVGEMANGVLEQSLLDRQHAGTPIQWRNAGDGVIRYDIEEQASRIGLECLQISTYRDVTTVRDSYRHAVTLTEDQSVQEAYENLAKLAERIEQGAPVLHHVSMMFMKGVGDNMEFCHSIGILLEAGLYGKLANGRFAFPKGKRSLLVGRSGCGKTTILHLVSGLVQRRDVSLIHNGSKERTYLLAQDAEPIRGIAIEDNVLMFARNTHDVQTVLDDLGLGTERVRSIDGTLSGGERKRILLAQAIVARPSLLVLDEPCAGLDLPRRIGFFQALAQHFDTSGRQGAEPPTVICADHDFIAIERFFDHVFEIVGGRLVCHR